MSFNAIRENFRNYSNWLCFCICQGLVDNPLCDVAEDMVRRRFSNMTGNYNGSVCEYLAAFLDDGPKTTSYDWRDALENLNELFGAIYTYGNVSTVKPV